MAEYELEDGIEAEADVPFIYSDESTEGAFEQEPHGETSSALKPGTGPTHPLRSDTWILLGTGSLLLCAGIALVLAPEYSETVVKIGGQLAAFGMHGGTLILAGLVFFALGVLSRGVARIVNSKNVAAPAPTPGRDPSLRVQLSVDRLATDLGQFRTSLFQIAEEVSSISETQQALLRQQLQQNHEAQTADQQNALFRLAASLDRMTASMDERLDALAAHVEQRIGCLVEKLEGTSVELPQASEPVGTPQAPTFAESAAPLEATLPQPPVPSGLDAQSGDFFKAFQSPPAAPGASPDPDGIPGALPSFPRQDAKELDMLLPDDMK